MIISFANQATENIFDGKRTKQASKACPATLWKIAIRKLDQLNQAETLGDLRSPPGNRLEKLKGDRSDQHSIRINDQYRVCFVWTNKGPTQVEVTDYHRS
ncbi:MAG: type II toxin-antitoxin system RelE/ParE family toxin [Rhodothermia bacterium]|nr:MAG: type II toxin-antitoxin system RelE/ParE family toxin [Rhodothermia bacterium]